MTTALGRETGDPKMTFEQRSSFFPSMSPSVDAVDFVKQGSRRLYHPPGHLGPFGMDRYPPGQGKTCPTSRTQMVDMQCMWRQVVHGVQHIIPEVLIKIVSRWVAHRTRSSYQTSKKI